MSQFYQIFSENTSNLKKLQDHAKTTPGKNTSQILSFWFVGWLPVVSMEQKVNKISRTPTSPLRLTCM